MIGNYYVTGKDLKEHVTDLDDDALVCIYIKGQVPILLEAVAEITPQNGKKVICLLNGYGNNELDLIK